MTRGGDTRAQTGLGLWLAASALAHALAVPLLKEGPTTDSGQGGGLRVTLVAGASPASVASTSASVPSEDAIADRVRDTQRLRAPRAPRPTVTHEAASSDSSPTPAAQLATATAATVMTAEPPPANNDRPLARGEQRGSSAVTENPGTPIISRHADTADTPSPANTTAAALATDRTVIRMSKASAAALTRPDPPKAMPTQATTLQQVKMHTEVQGHDKPIEKAEVGSIAAPAARAAPQTAAPEASVPTAAPFEHTATPARSMATLAADASPANAAAAAGSDAPAVSLAGVTAPAETSANTGAGASGALLALLHRAINEHKRYPSLARRQRREGIATVLFRLHPDGALDRLEVAASSGFEMLDKAALRAVAGVAPFAPATRYLDREKQFSVDVEFRLF